MHTAIDIANDLPQFVIITDGRQHDMRVAREQMAFRPNDTVLMDKAYVDYTWMDELNVGGVTFVTRAKKNCHFKVVESREVNRTGGLRSDQTVYLSSAIAGKKYEGKLRRVSFRDPETGKWLVFLTNNFDLAAMTIAKLYKARWDVELL